MSPIYLIFVVVGVCMFSMGYIGQILDEIISSTHKDERK